MLTRNHPPIVRTAGNKYMPGGGNSYDHTNNPYSQSGGSTPVNSAPTPATSQDIATPKPPKKAEPKETGMDSNQEAKVKTGYLHAIAGLTQATHDHLYNVGYDEGISVLAEHYSGGTSDLDWRPQGTHGIIAAATDDGRMVYVAGRGDEWRWWTDTASGSRMSVQAAVAAAEQAVASIPVPRLGAMLDDIVHSNPGIQPEVAVRIARKAHHLAVEASTR